MKRLLSFVLSILISLLSVSVLFSTFAQENKQNRIEGFIGDCLEVTSEYDENKEFQPVNDIDVLSDSLKFQTSRLFVKCSHSFDDMGAVEAVSGFNAWHLLQYATPKKAKEAYNYYSKLDFVESVDIDLPLEVNTEGNNNNTYVTKDDFLGDYSRSIMGFTNVLEYIDANNINTSNLRVGVIDTGIDYNHEAFSKRLFRTYFNATNTGDENDEYDVGISNAHGTRTTSQIIINTPDSIEVGCYKTLDEKGETNETKTSWIVAALLRAYTDGCSIINMSLTMPTNYGIFEDTLNSLRENDVAIFVGAGNDHAHDTYGREHHMLCTNENVIAVGASDEKNSPASFTNSGPWVEFVAPSNNIALASPNNTYSLASGTSFSSPLACAEYAIIKAINKTISLEKAVDLMAYTCQDVISEYDNNAWYGTVRYGSGVLDAAGAFCKIMNIQRTSNVKFSLEEDGCYHKGDELTLSSDSGASIYYSIDGSLPDKDSGIKYTNPIILENENTITAVAYSDNAFQSQPVKRFFLGFDVGTDDMFKISDDGEIVSYTGEFEYLEIPETINGTTVTSVHYDLFAQECLHTAQGYGVTKANIIALKLPDTVEYINSRNDNGFCLGNKTIKYFYADGLKRIYSTMFYDCEKLQAVKMDNAEYMEYQAFSSNKKLKSISFPKVTHIDEMGIENVTLWNVDLPSLQTFDNFLFYQSNIENANLSKLKYGTSDDVDVSLITQECTWLANLFLPSIECMYYTDLKNTNIYRIEFSSIKKLYTLPYNLMSDHNCIITTPHTMKKIEPKYLDYNKSHVVPVFYGTKGSYAEEWANENDIEFIELDQKSAIIKNVRNTCNEYTTTLFFDSLGFNKKYQWYGSFDKSTNNGVALDGANEELLQLKDYREYPYYYCVCTSTDIDKEAGFEHRELFYSDICINTDYIGADYTEYNKAIEKANALDKSLYKDFSRVEEAINNDVSNLTISQQSMVDAATKEILNAIEALELKETESATQERETESSAKHTTQKHVENKTEITTKHMIQRNKDVTTTKSKTKVNRDLSKKSPETGNRLFLIKKFYATLLLMSIIILIQLRKRD